MRSVKKYEKAFWILFIFMAVYYGYRMFALTPWYDELYTYYCFISKGPVYAAVHWPLPNNHVGYSVLSAVLDLFGNSYIGLRGVSYLCALANMRLLYRIAERYTRGWLPFAAVVLYVSMNLVNQMAVQGRGYTLGITCFLTAFYCMIRICGEAAVKKRFWFLYAGALALGLYAVSSNVYWVVPLCLSGGLHLLIQSIRQGREEKCFFLKTERGRRLLGLVIASLAAAFLTVCLYATIWLAIGSNLLVKDAESIYYGMGHVQMILKSPFAAIRRGMEYMLDTPYIQSEERAGFTGRLGSFLVSLSGYYFNFPSPVGILLWLAGIIAVIRKVIAGIRKREDNGLLLQLLLLVTILFIPACLLIQCKRPYYRVFTFGGVIFALLLTVLIESLSGAFSALRIRSKGGLTGADGRKRGPVTAGRLALVLLTVFFVKCIFFSGYNAQYGEKEHAIQQAFTYGDVEMRSNIAVTDCNQEYLLYFLYGIRCENREIEGADLVLLDKRMTDPEFDEMVWEFYHYYDSIPWDYIETNLTKVYENEDYILYTK